MTTTAEVKLPEGRVYELPIEPHLYYDGLEGIGIGPRFGGHIRKGDWYLELGGPRHNYTSFLFAEWVEDYENLTDGKVTLIGPELNEVPEESSFPFAYYISVGGPALTIEYFPMVERSMTMGLGWIEGVMVIGARSQVWMRVSKKMAPKHSIRTITQACRAMIRSLVLTAERIEQKVIIATPEMGGVNAIAPLLDQAQKDWEAYDAKRAITVTDEEVDTYYGCTICRLIAPTHVCVCTPERAPYCGFLEYTAMKVFAEVDPAGFIFPIEKEETLDAKKGWFSGVDKAVYEKSSGRTRKVYLNSCIEYPTTN